MARTGEKLGPYSILGPLGSGGMGEVFLARDSRLNREVALKVLPKGLSGDAELLARFEREALALASLNHPNIATIHGFEESADGDRFLVLERIEGATLAERLEAGALTMAECMQVGLQVAAAIEAAHERGVVHRDLKPGNVMLSSRGVVKVFDFGLAMREAATGTAAGPAFDAVNKLTGMGIIMGTPGYMSPEQVLAQPQDHRSDIFSFGCLMYECMAGERAFGGTYLLQVTAAALSATPDWSRLPEGTPEAMRALLAKCVEKDPSHRPQTMHEVRAIVEMALGHRTSFETRISEAPARSNLPTDLSTFVGRELELAECATLLQETRLLTLTGLGGSGKTRMALRIGRERMHEYDGGVWFVDLAPLADPERVPGAVAEALGLRDVPGESLVETLCSHLAGRRTLLLLDNCEHVLAACSRLLERLLHECAQLGVVATSREGLGMDGEQIFAVRSLSTPDLKNLPPPAELLFFESVRLFVDRAALSRHDFHLTAENSRAVAEICCRLDGVPLALELAAARARVLTLEQIRAKLDDRFRLLTGGSKGSVARHQTLQAAMQWSYDQLVEEEKSLFRAFSVFADGWSLEAAAAVVGGDMDEFEVIDVLTRLVDKSLVQVDGVGGSGIRYHMLESVRQYAFERLEECGESFSRRDRHLDYFLALAEARRAGLPPGEHDNAIAALEWASRVPEAKARALELAGTLAFFWRDRGHLELGARWLKSVLETCDAGEVSPGKALACFGAATVSLERKRMDEASKLLDEAVGLFRSLGDDSGLGRALNARAVVALIQGETKTARGLLEHSVAAFRRSPSPATASDALNNLAELAREEGDPERAYGLYAEALAVCAADATSRPVFLLNMAMISVTRRAFEPAREQLQACLEQVKVEMSSYAGAPALDVCGALAAAMRHSERAVRFYGAATALLDKVGGTRDPLDQQTHDPLIAQLRESLGEHRFAEADAAGRALTFQAALDEAIEWLAAPGLPLPEPRPKTSRRATRQAPWP